MKKLSEWHFDFGVSAADSSRLVSHEECARLLEAIIEYAEKHGLAIGGGYRPYTADDIT